MTEFFINNAWAQQAPAGGGGIAGFLPLIIILLVFWFFLIRPQMKQAKEHKKMVEALAKGDEVVTSGGLLGKINQVGDNFVVLEIARELEERALAEDYFIERKLYPNVDFYSGIIYRAIGIPTNMFTVMFALGRLPGWIAQWKEMMENPQHRLARPRQIYTGPTVTDFIPMEQRP